jgi:hypothetical protein
MLEGHEELSDTEQSEEVRGRRGQVELCRQQRGVMALFWLWVGSRK